MMDKEMVRKALECIAEDRQKSCTGCEYSILGLYPFCVHGIARDALALLQEQEAVEPSTDMARNRRCPKCFTILKGKFCHECGQVVEWK